MQIVTAFFGSLGFAILFNIRGSKLFWASLGGGIDWCVYLLAGLYITGEGKQYFLAALVLGIYSEVMARVKKVPTTMFLVVGFIPLIPGASLYNTMHYGIAKNWELFFSYGIKTATIAVAISTGIVLSMILFISIRNIYSVIHKNINR